MTDFEIYINWAWFSLVYKYYVLLKFLTSNKSSCYVFKKLIINRNETWKNIKFQLHIDNVMFQI